MGGVFPRIIPTQSDGTLALSDVASAIQPRDVHCGVTRLICLENTHNVCGGVPLSVAYTASVGALAREHGLRLHVDGARLFNAAAALNCDVADLVEPADSVMICLSKGLAAPIGSLLAGSAAFVERARYLRKMLGGGMRQVGVLAGPGLVALQTMPSRLARDHAVAKLLAARLRKHPKIRMEYEPHTNMMHFAVETTKDEQALSAAFRERGILVDPDLRRWRICTHYQIDEEAVETIAKAFEDLL